MNPHKPALDAQPLENLRQTGKRCGIDLATRAVELFQRDVPRSVARLLQAIDTGDASMVERNAHSLSGSAAQIGARRLASLGRYVETRRGDSRRLRRLRGLFEIELDDALIALSAQMKSPQVSGSRATRVLIAEDEPHVALFFTHALAAEGYETQHAATSGDIVDAIRTFRPDVILLDWFLEDATAATVLEQLNAFGPAPAVIALSSRAQESARILDLAKYGISGALPKPIGPHALVAALKTRGFESVRC